LTLGGFLSHIHLDSRVNGKINASIAKGEVLVMSFAIRSALGAIGGLR